MYNFGFILTISDFDECMNTSVCNPNAFCNNTIGSFICTCNLGYSGNGFSCVGKLIVLLLILKVIYMCI